MLKPPHTASMFVPTLKLVERHFIDRRLLRASSGNRPPAAAAGGGTVLT